MSSTCLYMQARLFATLYYYNTYNYNHTVQVEYLRQWLEEKHHQRKLQRVMTTTCASGVYALAAGRRNTTSARFKGSKVQRSGPASGQVGAGCSNIQLQPSFRLMIVSIHVTKGSIRKKFQPWRSSLVTKLKSGLVLIYSNDDIIMAGL